MNQQSKHPLSAFFEAELTHVVLGGTVLQYQSDPFQKVQTTTDHEK